MTQQNMMNRLYLAKVIEENEQGFHRETLWYGGAPANLALMIIDVMKDWYEPNIDDLDEAIIRYHKMLEDKDNITFDMMKGEGFNTGGMSMTVELTSNINDMFGFIVSEICDIYAKNGETLESFDSLAEFREHFTTTYDIDEAFQKVLEGVNEMTVSNALLFIDMKYNYTMRHFKNG